MYRKTAFLVLEGFRNDEADTSAYSSCLVEAVLIPCMTSDSSKSVFSGPENRVCSTSNSNFRLSIFFSSSACCFLSSNIL